MVEEQIVQAAILGLQFRGKKGASVASAGVGGWFEDWNCFIALVLRFLRTDRARPLFQWKVE